MKKHFLTIAVMALFAIGFTASDEDESSNGNSSESSVSESKQSVNNTKEVKQAEFFEPGHTYVSNQIKEEFAVCELYYQYIMKLYKDGSVELTRKSRYPNHEYEDYSQTVDCKMKYFHESKRDIFRDGYNIEGSFFSDGQTQYINFGVDMKGHIYAGGVDWERLGNSYDGYFTKQ